MKYFFDLNVLIDSFFDQNQGDICRNLVDKVENGECIGYISTVSCTTFRYIAKKHVGSHQAQQMVRYLLENFIVLPYDEDIIYEALLLGRDDLEDAVQYISAKTIQVSAIITHNTKDFECSDVAIVKPSDITH